jgi:DNA-binding transcriptional regulator GbsR (MarR family)
MYGKGDLTKYSSEEDFISAFKQLYTAKAEKDINAAKRDKAETPEAKARAEDDRKKVADGLKMVMGLF